MVSERLAYKMLMPLEMRQLADEMLDKEGFCICGRLIRRWEGKFLLAAVMPSKGMTTLAAYCQPCSQILNAALIGLKKSNYFGGTAAIPSEQVPRKTKDVG